MKNNEQLLYFFLSGKISLSQYDYKFMANLQSMIQNNSRVTSNQADLFDRLISKYSKQLTKNGYLKEELKSLSWKTTIVESTSEYTGAFVRLVEDEIIIRVPFNKTFIGKFRSIDDNSFVWDKAEKIYRSSFSTVAFKITHDVLPNFFPSVQYCETLQRIIDEIKVYENHIWNPTAKKMGDRIVLIASNEILDSVITDDDLKITPNNLFKLTRMGVMVDPVLYENDEKLRFAASLHYVTDINDYETTISWMKNVGCENVILGRGIRSVPWRNELISLVEKYGMKADGPMFSPEIKGITMLIQHVSSIDTRTTIGPISKTIVITDSRPIEVL